MGKTNLTLSARFGGATRFPHGYDALRIILALLLLFAAELKAHQFATEWTIGEGSKLLRGEGFV